MEKNYLVGYKGDYLVFGHGDIRPILGIKPIDLDEARRAVMELPSDCEVIVYQLVPVKVYPADLDARAALVREESSQSVER
jgi:hypothetical protein